jgi:uncharacterized cupin superfamily protein
LLWRKKISSFHDPPEEEEFSWFLSGEKVVRDRRGGQREIFVAETLQFPLV